MPLVTAAIEHIGLRPIAERFGYRISAIHKWKKQGRLPRTDLAGITHYASGIEELSGGKFSAHLLLEETRRAWIERRKLA